MHGRCGFCHGLSHACAQLARAYRYYLVPLVPFLVPLAPFLVPLFGFSVGSREGCGVRYDAHDRLKRLWRSSHLHECTMHR